MSVVAALVQAMAWSLFDDVGASKGRAGRLTDSLPVAQQDAFALQHVFLLALDGDAQHVALGGPGSRPRRCRR